MPKADPKIRTDDQNKDDDQAADTGQQFDDLRSAANQIPMLGEEGEATETEAPKVGKADLEDMTKAMRKRLLRERRRFDTVLAEALAKKEEEFNARLAAIEARGAGADGSGDSEDKDLDKQIEEAMEAGRSKDVARLTRQLAESVARKSARGTTDEPEDLPGTARPAESTPKRLVAVLPRVQEWTEDQPWWDDPGHAHVRDWVAKKVDSKLQAAGYSPRQDDYYAELERIIDERFPGVVVKTSEKQRDRRFDSLLDDEPDDDFAVTPKGDPPRKRPAQAPVMGADDGAGELPEGETPRRRGAIRLTERDLQTMRTFNLDPQNPEHVKGFIENRGS